MRGGLVSMGRGRKEEEGGGGRSVPRLLSFLVFWMGWWRVAGWLVGWLVGCIGVDLRVGRSYVCSVVRYDDS